MKNAETKFYTRCVDNIRKIMSIKGLTQSTLAADADISSKALSKVMTGTQLLSLDMLSKIATALSLREIDLITYPERYELAGNAESGPAEVLLQLRLTKEKKDQVLKLVFGENNIEILDY